MILPTLSAQPVTVVKAIEVEGNKTIGIATILSKIKTRVGQEYLKTVVSDDLKRLYNTGYFSDVSVDKKDSDDGVKVIFYLQEKPIVEDITFSKTRYIKSRAIQNKIKTKTGKFLDNKTLQDDVHTIKELYGKKGLTSVTVNVDTIHDEVTNKATLHFIIREGQRVKIRQINIFGNIAYRDKKILRLIKTRADSLFTSGILKEEILKEDMQRIRGFYEKEGYIDARASYAVDPLLDGRVSLNIDIEEGNRYYVGKITITGEDVVSENKILSSMDAIKPGSPFSREKFDVDLANIRSLYFDHGYIFAKVDESTSMNPRTGQVDVRININEGKEAYINKIKVQGNTRTRDIVIRRELKMYPGDTFDGTKLRRSKERLRNLGYFEEVSYDIEDTLSPNQKDLVVQVKETKTGSFSFGGGFSTVDQIVGFVAVEQRNFDFTNWPTFTGGGQHLVLRAETGSTRNNLRLSFTEPWIFDYPISGGFDAYRTSRTRERDVGFAYDEERLGGDIRFGKQLTEYLKGSVIYRLEEITIDNLEDGVSADLTKEEGTNTVSLFGFDLAQDKRDSIFNPGKGYYLTGGLDVAGGALGGDKDFLRLSGAFNYYVPVPVINSSVLEFRVQTGIVDAYGDSDDVPIFERFFAGGARTIRGYEERKVGPIDSSSEDPIGGESLLVGNVEYIVPLVDFLKLATFFDVGNVWKRVEDYGSGEFKAGAGAGVRIKTPIGPVNLDYGYPLNDEPGEEERSGKFYFSVSRGF